MAKSRVFTAAVALLVGLVAGSFVAGSLLQGQPSAPAIPRELTSYREIVKKVLPAVVSIEARAKPAVREKQPAPRRRPRIDDSLIPEEFRRFFEEFDRLPFDMPEMPPQAGFGSGFIIDPKGVVLTNNHVVEGADQVEVQLHDGRKFTSREIFTDPKTDLAIVKISASAPLPYLELGDSDAMAIGDRVLAVGAPFGLVGSVTHGIISGKGRNGLNMTMYEDYLQTDAPINPGNSGGPLVNLEGKVIGINSAIKSRSGGFQGVGLAVNSNLARSVVEQLTRHGMVRRGYLGVQIKDLDPAVASRLGIQDGVLIASVFDDSPAAKGGVQAGDIVTAVDGKPVKDGKELQRVVANLPLGKPVQLSLIRDGKPLSKSVTIQEQPREFGASRTPLPRAPRSDRDSVTVDKVGVQVSDLTPELAEQLGLPVKSGVVVTQVEPGSLAEQAGLRRGVVITKVENQPVTSASALKEAIDKAAMDRGVLLQVQSPQGGTDYVLLKSAEASTRK
jgi:serine protease Do